MDFGLVNEDTQSREAIGKTYHSVAKTGGSRDAADKKLTIPI